MFDIEKYGMKNRGTAGIDSSGASFMHYGPSGDPKMRDNIYNDHESGDIWSKDGTYIGSISMEDGLKNAEFQRIHNEIAADDNEFNSHNDVAAVVQHLYGDKKSSEPGKTFNDYEFSPQIQEAMDRAQTYRENAWSGQHAQDVYGKSNELAKQSKFYQEPGDETNNGAQAASDSATAKHFDAGKYKTDYSENEFKHFKTQY